MRSQTAGGRAPNGIATGGITFAPRHADAGSFRRAFQRTDSVEFLVWLRDTSYVTWVRESTSLLGYTLYLALHTIGLVFLVGPNLLIAARVLGVAPQLPLSPMRSYVPIMNVGLATTFITGSVLFATAPDGFVKNEVFLSKILFVVLAVVALRLLLRELYGTRRTRTPDRSAGGPPADVRDRGLLDGCRHRRPPDGVFGQNRVPDPPGGGGTGRRSRHRRVCPSRPGEQNGQPARGLRDSHGRQGRGVAWLPSSRTGCGGRRSVPDRGEHVALAALRDLSFRRADSAGRGRGHVRLAADRLRERSVAETPRAAVAVGRDGLHPVRDHRIRVRHRHRHERRHPPLRGVDDEPVAAAQARLHRARGAESPCVPSHAGWRASSRRWGPRTTRRCWLAASAASRWRCGWA